ncbi:MAG: hypothetical protein ABI883_00840, partial [Chthoniobacterales bacterium]
DDDFRLLTVLKRQPWPARGGVENFIEVRKLTMQDSSRNTRMWSKVETDTAYRELCRHIWDQIFDVPIPGMETPADLQRVGNEQIDRAVKAVTKLQARGVPVLFVRPPSADAYLRYEDRDFPRALTWDVLLQRTGVAGIHFQDYPELQGFTPPEWSHLSGAEAEKFTKRLCAILQRDFGWTARAR